MCNTLVFYCNWGVGTKNGNQYLSSVHYLYLSEALHNYDNIVLISKESKYTESMAVMLNDSRIKVHHLPAMKSYFSAISKFTKIKGVIKDVVANNPSADFYLRSPEPFSWLFNYYKNKNQTLVYHFMSNPIEAILCKKDDPTYLKFFKLALYLPEFFLNCFSARVNITSCNGQGLKENLLPFISKNTIILNESTVKKNHIIPFSELRSKTLSSGVVNLLYVGYIRAAKGIDYLLDAVYSLDKDKNYHLHLVGSGDYVQNVKDRIKHLSLSENITLHGHLEFGDNLFDLYKSCDIFVFPSLSEGSPRVVLEAMAFGLPVIATDVGNTINLLKDDRGICIKPASPSELTQAINIFIENDDLRFKCQKNALEFVQKNTIHSFMFNFKSICNHRS